MNYIALKVRVMYILLALQLSLRVLYWGDYMKNKDLINFEVGNRIQEIRLMRKMTQEELAEKADFSSANHVSQVECGVKGVSVPKLMEICRVLDIEADYLLFGVKADNAETMISKYISRMTDEQAAYVLELVKVYAKSCGIE